MQPTKNTKGDWIFNKNNSIRSFILTSVQQFCLSFSESYEGEHTPSNNSTQEAKFLGRSKQLRFEIKALCQQLASIGEWVDSQRETRSTEDLDSALEVIDYEYDFMTEINRCWYLIELFHLNPSRFIALELIDWIQECTETVPLTLFQSMQLKTHPEKMSNFWPTVHLLVAQGKLFDAWAMLSLHSNISLLLVNGNRLVHALHDVLISHPYMTSESSIASDLMNAQSLSVDVLRGWKEKVAALRSVDISIALRIPELEIIVSILEGVSINGSGISKVGVLESVICQLMYSHTPQLSRPSLFRILQNTQKDWEKISDDKSALMTAAVMVFSGAIPPVLSLPPLSLSLDSTPRTQPMCLISLLCGTHLSLLLSQSSIPTASQYLPLAQELLSRSLSQFASPASLLSLPPQTVCCYLQLLRSVEPASFKNMLAIVTGSLSRRYLRSDKEAEELATVLRDSLHDSSEANSVLCAHAVTWLKKGCVARAAVFYVRAEAWGRLASILEAQLAKAARVFALSRSLNFGLGLVPFSSLGDGVDDGGIQQVIASCEAVLSTLERCVLAADKPLSQRMQKQRLGLSLYIGAVRDVLRAQEPPSPGEDPHAQLAVSLLRRAADNFSLLLLSDSFPKTDAQPLVSQELWLHLLELCVCLHRRIALLEAAQSLDEGFLSKLEEDGEFLALLSDRWGQGAYSKVVAVRLHGLFYKLESLPNAKHLFEQSRATPERLMSLRVCLTGMVTSCEVASNKKMLLSRSLYSQHPREQLLLSGAPTMPQLQQDDVSRSMILGPYNPAQQRYTAMDILTGRSIYNCMN